MTTDIGPVERVRPRQDAAPINVTNAVSVTPTIVIWPVLEEVHVLVLLNPQGRFVRRAYMSLHAAEKAHQRSLDAGEASRLVLCTLTPVGGDLDA